MQFLFVCFYPFRESRPEARALIDRLQGIRPLAATSRDPEHQRREQRDDHLHVAIGQQEGGLAQTAMIPFRRAAATPVLRRRPPGFLNPLLVVLQRAREGCDEVFHERAQAKQATRPAADRSA